MKASELFDLTVLQNQIGNAIDEMKREDCSEWIIDTIVDSWEGQYIASTALVAFGATAHDSEEWQRFYDGYNPSEHGSFGMTPSAEHYAWHMVDWKYDELDKVADDIASELPAPEGHSLYFGSPIADYCLILYKEEPIE